MASIDKEIEDLFNKRTKYIDKSLKTSYKEMESIQKELTALVFKKYLNKFDIENGKIVFTNKNLRLIDEVDTIFEQFAKKYTKNIFKNVGLNMLDMVVYSEDYFKKFGNKALTFQKIEGKLNTISNRIGISKDGQLIKGSYLDRLATAPKFKEELKDYVAKGLSENITLKEFQNGFLDLIEGSKDVDGAMLRYWKMETHDAFFSVSRAQDDLFAQKLGMEFFIYLPGKIDKTRSFCEEKIGKCFHRLDAEKWRDKEWQGKNKGYNPLINMGGYNCRHSPAWVSNLVVKKRFPEKYKEYESILNDKV